MIHLVPTGNILVLLQEFMLLVTPTLFHQEKPVLMSELALQAKLKSSIAVYSKASCGEVTSTAEICSLPIPALVRVAFDVHFQYHTHSSAAVKCAARPLPASPTVLPRKMLLWEYAEIC